MAQPFGRENYLTPLIPSAFHGEGFTLPFGPETSGSKERIHPEGDRE